MKEDFIPFALPSIGSEEVDAVREVLESGWLTTGPRAAGFEEAFRGYTGAKHAVALSSCTAGLHLSLEAIGLKAGDAVITTTVTFASTAGVVRYFDADPILVDVEPDTLNIDPAKICKKIYELKASGRHVKAIMPVHFAGHVCEMAPILELAKDNGLYVIEDAAHAFPAEYKGRRVGSIGDTTCFSFYATKTITSGEGGMVTTDNEAMAERMRMMSLHGISKDAWKRYSAEGSWYYEIMEPGFKYNMTDIAAAIGLVQFAKADEMREKRREIAQAYNDAFSGSGIVTAPASRDYAYHSWHLYVIRLNTDALKIGRNEFIDELKARGIGVSVHFIPLHIHPYYQKTYGYAPGDMPVAYDAYQRMLSLPIYPSMTDAQVMRVIDAVMEVSRKFSK